MWRLLWRVCRFFFLFFLWCIHWHSWSFWSSKANERSFNFVMSFCHVTCIIRCFVLYYSIEHNKEGILQLSNGTYFSYVLRVANNKTDLLQLDMKQLWYETAQIKKNLDKCPLIGQRRGTRKSSETWAMTWQKGLSR